MKKYQYQTVVSGFDGKEWVINYNGRNFNEGEYKDAIFNELGNSGWELVSTSTYIGSETKSAALIPIRADTVVSLTYTTGEAFYFRKELTDESSYPATLMDKMSEIKSFNKRIKKEDVEYLENKTVTHSALKTIQDKMSADWIVISPKENADLSIQKENIETIKKSSFLGKSTKTIEKEIVVNIEIDTKSLTITYRAWEKFLSESDWIIRENKSFNVTNKSLNEFVDYINNL